MSQNDKHIKKYWQLNSLIVYCLIMKKDSNNFVYDLCLIGNGVAAKKFLIHLSENAPDLESKSQNFFVAQVFCEKMTPSCSLKSSVTISLNGISEDVSQLGNEMREGYFEFCEFYKKNHPRGIHPVRRVVVSTCESEDKKLIRRYGGIDNLDSDYQRTLLKSHLKGVEYDAFIVNTKEYLNFLDEKITLKNRDIVEEFVVDMKYSDGLFHLQLKDGRFIKSKKLLLASGAFSKVYEHFFDLYSDLKNEEIDLEIKNQVKSGSYLTKKVSFNRDPFYLVIDGHKILYYKDHEGEHLSVATVTNLGPNEAFDAKSFQHIFELFKAHSAIDLGEMSEYRYICGLRHKGPKRLLMAGEIASQRIPGLYRINGLYKNGFTLSFLAAKRVYEEMFRE